MSYKVVYSNQFAIRGWAEAILASLNHDVLAITNLHTGWQYILSLMADSANVFLLKLCNSARKPFDASAWGWPKHPPLIDYFSYLEPSSTQLYKKALLSRSL